MSSLVLKSQTQEAYTAEEEGCKTCSKIYMQLWGVPVEIQIDSPKYAVEGDVFPITIKLINRSTTNYRLWYRLYQSGLPTSSPLVTAESVDLIPPNGYVSDVAYVNMPPLDTLFWVDAGYIWQDLDYFSSTLSFTVRVPVVMVGDTRVYPVPGSTDYSVLDIGSTGVLTGPIPDITINAVFSTVNFITGQTVQYLGSSYVEPPPGKVGGKQVLWIRNPTGLLPAGWMSTFKSIAIVTIVLALIGLVAEIAFVELRKQEQQYVATVGLNDLVSEGTKLIEQGQMTPDQLQSIIDSYKGALPDTGSTSFGGEFLGGIQNIMLVAIGGVLVVSLLPLLLSKASSKG